MPLFSPIHHQFGPMADGRQALRALGMLCVPWKWRRGESALILTEHLGTTFRGNAFLFGSGREGLLALLRALQVREGDEVIIQAYTCIAVPNAIHAAGARPVFVDIDPQTLNLDIEETRRAITPRTRAILCQHTFGIPSDAESLQALCKERRIPLIEDCAHVLPDRAGPAEIGRRGDFLLLSFGREKAISGVSGGAIVSRQEPVSRALKLTHMHAGHLSHWTIARLLLYPIAYVLARPLYGILIGKAFLKLLQLLHLLVPIYDDNEKEGHMSPVIRKLPNACAALALAQWRELQRINDHRRLLTRFYLEEGKKRPWLRPLLGVSPDLPLQKFPLFLSNAREVRAALKTRNIHLDDGWTGCVIGCDPRTEHTAMQILSLPTHPGMTMAQAKRLLGEIDATLG